MILTGQEIKELFTSKKGVVFFDGITLAFINCNTLERTYKFSDEDKEPGEKKIIIGENFDLVDLLKSDKKYSVEIGGKWIIFKDAQTGQLELVVEGIVNY